MSEQGKPEQVWIDVLEYNEISVLINGMLVWGTDERHQQEKVLLSVEVPRETVDTALTPTPDTEGAGGRLAALILLSECEGSGLNCPWCNHFVLPGEKMYVTTDVTLCCDNCLQEALSHD